MSQLKADPPSLIMVILFTTNMIISYYDRHSLTIPETVGQIVFVLGLALCAYVVVYLRSGFFGETEPNLNQLVTAGPYRICRHPLYAGFIVLLFGVDLMLGSVVAVLFTFLLSIPSAIYRAIVEDNILRKKFGKEWEEYASKVGFMLPWVGRWHP
jgi:protein-S-isoprenylcysteine O-methyltransferase Ste14